MKKLLNLIENQNGATVVLVGLLMVFLLGITALVIDGGRLYSEKSKLQKAVDAAVLGGGQVLVNSQSQAKSVAKDLSQKNTYSLTDSDLEVTSSYIKVSKKVSVPMTFAKVLGVKTVDVSASAKVIVGPLKAGKDISPIAVEKSAIPNGTQLKCDNTGNNTGNCGYLDFNGSGANGLADAIKNGSDVSINSDYAVTETGQKWGPVKDAFQFLIDSDANKPQCQSAATADQTCKRVLFVAVIDSWKDASGKSTVKIVGLAAYWLESVTGNKELKGQFIKMVGPGEIGSIGIGEYNLYGVKLVE
ncbi:TadE/TadG family type IV pilus assembly protein [Gottfriedia acidiceleris]|uniref:TadE/TadG family type IV pilus assembly protein n=1 Tax=Gottfriedia acidiceleris TaxID=371036 RepID=UPI00101DF4A0|nr:pilus assembly protein TadG-related protein [Gottfriedia acidiceleris]